MVMKSQNSIQSLLTMLKANLNKIYHKVKHNYFTIGLISLFWYLIRTGTKPSRSNYPCQKVAATNVNILFALYILPLISFVKRKGKKPLVFAMAAILIIFFTSPFILEKISPVRAGPQDIFLTIEEHTATSGPSSDIYVVTNTTGYDNGFLASINLMGENGLKFYKSDTTWKNQGPDGLIANDDVIIIKVNSQWNQRGGTNTDLLKSIIKAITNHPDGFTGEIVVADNGQAQYGSSGTGGSLDWVNSNAEDHSQSVQDVVDQFSGSFKVSTYLWDTITETQVDEYSVGDMTDGFVVNTTVNPVTGIYVSYPKFQTVYGTNISFEKGIWNSNIEQYDNERLKIINVPVLKTHTNFGVTACVKHYMGVPSDKLTSSLAGQSYATHSTVDDGGMGTLMAETRMPTLNILDAIWIKAIPWQGPWNNYSEATRVNVTMVSTDPIALDYWASKYVLMEASSLLGYTDLTSMDPDNPASGSFGDWLKLSMDEINKAGHQTTNDYTKMNVYKINMRARPTLEFKQGWNLISMPIQPADPSVISIFSEKIDNVEAIFSYSNGEWDFWIPGISSPLLSLQGGYGYWVLAKNNFDITLTGVDCDRSPLFQDWNLIGVNSTNPQITGEYLEETSWTEVHTYDEETSGWQSSIRDLGGPIVFLDPGEGYWVKIDTG